MVLEGSYRIWTTIAAFWLRSHRSRGWHPLPELIFWQRYHAKNYSAFLQKFIWITSNIIKLLCGCQVLGYFSTEKPLEIWANDHHQNYLLFSKDITIKTTQPFFKSLYELYLTLWNIYLQVKISLPENFLCYWSQVTCTSVQFNVSR